MTTFAAYQFLDDGTGQPRTDMILGMPDYVSIPNDKYNQDWIDYQIWLDDPKNVTYPIGYCFQSTTGVQPPVATDPVLEFPDWVIISSTDADLTLWNAYQDWWNEGWRPISAFASK